MNKNKHMNLECRTTIEVELGKGTSFKGIVALLGKDCTTVSKEIRCHASHEKTGAFGRGFNDCAVALRRNCQLQQVCKSCFSPSRKLCWSCGKCSDSCPSYVQYTCPRLKKPPYICYTEEKTIPKFHKSMLSKQPSA